MKSRGRTTRTIRSGWTIRHRTLHTQARIMSRGRISSRPAQETGAAAFSRRCKGPAQCHATQAREFPGTSRHALSRGRAGDTAHTSRTMGGGIWIDCAQERALRSPAGAGSTARRATLPCSSSCSKDRDFAEKTQKSSTAFGKIPASFGLVVSLRLMTSEGSWGPPCSHPRW
jgi:hypothetical protein